MIVVGTHSRRGIARLMLGSVAEELTRSADRPVLVVREGDAEKVEGAHLPLVLGAVDLGPESQRLTEEAAELAQLVGGRLRLFHADPPRSPVPDPEWREAPEKSLARLARRLTARRLPVEIHVREGEPAETILSEAHGRGASFIVVGTHGRRGARRLLFGSVATDVLRRARVPVLIVRSQTPDAIGEGAALRTALFRAGLEPT